MKVGHDLKFDAIVLARTASTLRGLDIDTMLASYLLDATRSDTPARGSRARAHELQGADRRGRLRPRRQGRVARRRAGGSGGRSTPASAPISSVQLAPLFRELLEQRRARPTSTQTLELPLIPVLVAVERAGVRIDAPALAAQSQRIEQELAHAHGADLRARRRRVQHQLAEAARRGPVRQAAAAGAASAPAPHGAVDRRRSARGARARARPPAHDSRVARR